VAQNRRYRPINKFPMWKNISIIVILVLAFFFALPNFFGQIPAVQISVSNAEVNADLEKEVKDVLSKNNVDYKEIYMAKNKSNISLIFNDFDTQKEAKKIINNYLGSKSPNYIVAMNMLSNSPAWLNVLGATPMNLGLDLRGGMYLLLEADVQTVVDAQLDNALLSIEHSFTDNNISYQDSGKASYKKTVDGVSIPSSFAEDGYVTIKFANDADVNKAISYLRGDFAKKVNNQFSFQKLDKNRIIVKLSMTLYTQLKQEAITQVVTVMRNRINALGVAEASVSQSGDSRVVIEIPGLQDAAQAKQILGGTSTAKFYLVQPVLDRLDAVKQGIKVYTIEDDRVGMDRYYQLLGNPVAGGSDIINASPSIDQQTGSPIVKVELSSTAARSFKEITGKNIGNPMGVMLVNTTYDKVTDGSGKTKNVVHTSQKLINAATIQSALGTNFQISGLSNIEANNLALMIRSGALQVPVHIVQEQQIGPSLGADNIEKGIISIVVALVLTLIFIMVYYRVFGIIANIALVLNLILIVAVMSIIPGATLTLPGIAGIVLNLGMSIDGNVLIFERIREELRAKVPNQSAIHIGYEKAWATIVDSNLTTLIVAVILFFIGTGAVKGFAVTLMIGILTSMFTAVTVSRAMTNFVYGNKKNIKKLSIGI